jgi:Flp pilus assembly protein TadD
VADSGRKKTGPFGPGAWYDPSDWSYKPSPGFRAALQSIALIIVLILGFSVGLTATRSSAGAAGKLIDSLGGDYKAELEQAYSMIISGDYSGAASIASAVLQADDENPLAYHIMGLAHAHRGLTEEAALSFERATDLYPEFDVAWYDLGVVEESRGQFESALHAYRSAEELKPRTARYVDAANRMAKVVIGEGGWDWQQAEAERMFLDGVAAVNSGEQADLEYAENVFRTLLRDRPYDVASRNMLGLALAKQGEVGEAERVFLQAVSAEPGFADAWYNLGMLHRSQGRLEEALEDFETAYSSSSLDTFRAITQRQIAEIEEILAGEIDIAPTTTDILEPVTAPTGNVSDE